MDRKGDVRVCIDSWGLILFKNQELRDSTYAELKRSRLQITDGAFT